MTGFTYKCIISATDRGPVVVVPREGNWSLPQVTSREGWLAQAVPEIRARVHADLGLDAVVVRELQPDAGTVCAEMEPITPGWRDLPGARWKLVDLSESNDLEDSERSLLLAWWGGLLDEPGTRRPWERRGWFLGASTWIEGRARSAGLQPSGKVQQVKAAWEGSCVLELPTADGSLFFKAYPTRGPGEGGVIRMLRRRWPENVPVLVAEDRDSGWMLMRDWGVASPLGAKQLATALRRFGEIQRWESSRVDSWRSVGCQERGLAQMELGMERWLIDLTRLLRRAGALSQSECKELERMVGPALAWCTRLREMAIPLLSIHHEDLREGNIVMSGGRPVFSDWSDTVL